MQYTSGPTLPLTLTLTPTLNLTVTLTLTPTTLTPTLTLTLTLSLALTLNLPLPSTLVPDLYNHKAIHNGWSNRGKALGIHTGLDETHIHAYMHDQVHGMFACMDMSLCTSTPDL